MRKSLLLFKGVVVLGCLFFISCATTTKVDSITSNYQAKSDDCEVKFYKNKEDKPSQNYESIGKIESHIKLNFFFGGKVKLEDDAFSELRKKACGLGGDAVLIDDFVESSVSEMTHVHVWATVIRFQEK
jgi:hypothetical protein